MLHFKQWMALEGIGLSLNFLPGTNVPIVIDLAPGKIAERCGQIRLGHALLAVGSQSTASKSLAQLSDMMIGPMGSAVVLHLRGERGDYIVKLERGGPGADQFRWTRWDCQQLTNSTNRKATGVQRKHRDASQRKSSEEPSAAMTYCPTEVLQPQQPPAVYEDLSWPPPPNYAASNASHGAHLSSTGDPFKPGRGPTPPPPSPMPSPVSSSGWGGSQAGDRNSWRMDSQSAGENPLTFPPAARPASASWQLPAAAAAAFDLPDSAVPPRTTLPQPAEDGAARSPSPPVPREGQSGRASAAGCDSGGEEGTEGDGGGGSAGNGEEEGVGLSVWEALWEAELKRAPAASGFCQEVTAEELAAHAAEMGGGGGACEDKLRTPPPPFDHNPPSDAPGPPRDESPPPPQQQEQQSGGGGGRGKASAEELELVRLQAQWEAELSQALASPRHQPSAGGSLRRPLREALASPSTPSAPNFLSSPAAAAAAAASHSPPPAAAENPAVAARPSSPAAAADPQCAAAVAAVAAVGPLDEAALDALQAHWEERAAALRAAGQAAPTRVFVLESLPGQDQRVLRLVDHDSPAGGGGGGEES